MQLWKEEEEKEDPLFSSSPSSSSSPPWKNRAFEPDKRTSTIAHPMQPELGKRERERRDGRGETGEGRERSHDAALLLLLLQSSLGKKRGGRDAGKIAHHMCKKKKEGIEEKC